MAVSAMNGTVLIMHGDARPDLLLSPQPLIDSQAFKDFDKMDNFCGDSELGLESVRTYPFLRMERDKDEWDEEAYKRRKYERHHICQITRAVRDDPVEGKSMNFCEEGAIVRKLKRNFCEGGKNYPGVGIMVLGRLALNKVALGHAVKGSKPYHPPDLTLRSTKKQKIVPEDNSEHAMLIVGFDSMNDDSQYHFCSVKNTHGKGWGKEGYTNVGFDSFKMVYFPRYHKERWTRLYARERKLRDTTESKHKHGEPSSVINRETEELKESVANGKKQKRIRKKKTKAFAINVDPRPTSSTSDLPVGEDALELEAKVISLPEKGVDGLLKSFEKLNLCISGAGHTTAKTGDHLQFDLQVMKADTRWICGDQDSLPSLSSVVGALSSLYKEIAGMDVSNTFKRF